MLKRVVVFFVIFVGFVLGVNSKPANSGKRHPLLSNSSELILSEGNKLLSTMSEEQLKITGELIKSARKDLGRTELKVDYPLDESVFPPEIIAPTFLWHDSDNNADTWLIDITLKNDEHIYILVPGDAPPKEEIDPRCVVEAIKYEPSAYQKSSRAWTPSTGLWAYIKKNTLEKNAAVKFYGFRSSTPTEVLSKGMVSMKTSADKVGAPIFYRDVPLVPSKTKIGAIKPLADGSLPLIQWRLRDISKPKSRVLLKDMPTCANCHSFSKDGKYLAMDLDGPSGDKGAYLVSPIAPQMTVKKEDVMTWNSFKGRPEGHTTIGFLSQVSPDGQYVISTVNESLYVSNFMHLDFLQVFYPTRGILAVYSKKTAEIKALPGADDPAYVHCDAVWTPDGKTIVFARAAAKEPYTPGLELAKYANDPMETKIQYDLYRMDFNDGKGGTPVPITGASGNGMSNTFPKISPDGKWIVFVKCKNGQLMRPDGKLWIVPITGGTAREMRCNTKRMNSWHSFSPNGRWMVFSSKGNTPYTQMFLTHIDETGNDSPSILVPFCTDANRAVNIPEFVNIPYDNLQKIEVPIVRYRTFYQAGDQLLKKGRLKEAVDMFVKSIKDNPEFDTAHYHLGATYFDLGKYDEALDCFQKAVRFNPTNEGAYEGLGNALYQLRRYKEAIEQYTKALKMAPRNPRVYFFLAGSLFELQRFEEAITAYTNAVRLDPGNAKYHNWLANALLKLGRFQAAVEHYRKGLGIDPNDHVAQINCANALFSLRELDEAIVHYKKALELKPRLADAYLNWGNVLFVQKKYQEAIEKYKKVLEINPQDGDARNNIGFAEDALRKEGVRKL